MPQAGDSPNLSVAQIDVEVSFPQFVSATDKRSSALAHKRSVEMSEKVSLPSLIASIVIFVAFLAFQFWLMMHSIN